MIFQWAKSRLLKFGLREIYIQFNWASLFVVMILGFRYDYDIPGGQIKIIKNRDSQKYNWIGPQYFAQNVKKKL